MAAPGAASPVADPGSLEADLAAHGLSIRGALEFGSTDLALSPGGTGGLVAPLLSSGETARGVLLIGYFGGAIWPSFDAWRTANPDLKDPLDDWSRAVIAPIAQAAGAEAAFPSDRPFHPFQQWAMAAEGLRPSPLGMLIHPAYGLWHGYRGAVLFGRRSPLTEGSWLLLRNAGVEHPCDSCEDRPCLSACPVEAFRPGGFDVQACRSHLKTESGRSGCMKSGCKARDACPVGRTHRYPDAQIRFHMAAFG